MIELKEKTVKLFGQQYDAFNFTSQFAAVVAGIQSGKTFLGSHWAAKKINEFPQGTGAIIAPTYKHLQQSTLIKFFQEYPYLQKYYKEQKGEIALPTGGTVFTRSADNPFGLEGMTLNWWWLDEGGLSPAKTWTVLRSRVAMTGGQGLITTTVYNLGWLYTDFYQNWKEKRDKSLSFYTWASIENPGFSREYYEAERSRLDTKEFARRYEGKFEKMTGLVWDIPESHIVAPLNDLMHKAQARILGVDWGFRNPSSIGVIYVWDKAYYLVDEWKQTEKITSEINQVALNKLKEHHATKVYPDPAEPDRLEEMRRAGLPVLEANKDVVGGINFIRQLIYEKRFFVYNTCTQFLDEASMYHYAEPKQDEKAPKEEPVKFNDHLCDAVRYAIYSHQPVPLNMGKATAPMPGYYPDDLGF